jgi:Na+/phosphate symporter
MNKSGEIAIALCITIAIFLFSVKMVVTGIRKDMKANPVSTDTVIRIDLK